MATVVFHVAFISWFLGSFLLALLFFLSIVGFLLAPYFVEVYGLRPIIGFLRFLLSFISSFFCLRRRNLAFPFLASGVLFGVDYNGFFNKLFVV
jgi:hypothetical protein